MTDRRTAGIDCFVQALLILYETKSNIWNRSLEIEINVIDIDYNSFLYPRSFENQFRSPLRHRTKMFFLCKVAEF